MPSAGNKNLPAIDGFEEWYALFPKHKGKGQARRAYAKVIASGIASHKDLCEGATRYATERAGKDPQFTKYPATWLNGECWLDEPELPKPPHPNKPTGGAISAAAGIGAFLSRNRHHE